MSAPKGNRYGAKPETDKVTAQVPLRCKKTEVLSWAAAADGPLAPWIRSTLNRAAARSATKREKEVTRASP